MDMLCFRNLQFKALFYAAARRRKKRRSLRGGQGPRSAPVC
jgi:hypothetical protein